MNELELKEMNQEQIVYRYKPEGEGDFGEVTYVFKDKQAVLTKKSSADATGQYGNKAILKIEKCVDNNNLPLRFTQAWY